MRAELIKLTRQQVVVATAIATAVIAIGGTAIGIAAAEPARHHSAPDPIRP